MDPTTVFCPNGHCHARGQIGQGNIGLHAQKEQRFICHWHPVLLTEKMPLRTQRRSMGFRPGPPGCHLS